MRENLAHNLKAVAANLDPQIADPVAYARVINLAGDLPPVADVVLETRLNTDVRQIDLSLCMDVGDAHFDAFAAGRAPRGGQQHPGWTGLRRVMAACANEEQLLAQSTSRFWLEFDVDETPPRQMLPGYYIDVHRLDRRASYAPGHTRVSHKVALARQLFHLALRHPWDEGHGAFLARCFDSLPAGTVVAYLGNMLPRGEMVTRFAVRGLQDDRLREYMRELAWPHDSAPLLRYSAALRPVADRLVFNLAAEGATLTPRIDLEFLPQGNRMDGWRAILRQLVALELCGPAQARALLAWAGVGPGPRSARPLFGRLQPMLQRGINHLKLVFRPGQPLELKAYLAVRQLWLDRARYRPAAVSLEVEA